MNSPAQSNCYNGFDLAKFIMAIFVVTLHAHPFSDFSFNLNYAVTHGVTRMAVPYFFIGAYLSQKASDLSLPRLKRDRVVFFMLFMTEVMGGSFCGWTQLNYSHDVYIILLHYASAAYLLCFPLYKGSPTSGFASLGIAEKAEYVYLLYPCVVACSGGGRFW